MRREDRNLCLTGCETSSRCSLLGRFARVLLGLVDAVRVVDIVWLELFAVRESIETW